MITKPDKPLAEWTEVEVDTELSRLWNEEAQAESARLALVSNLHMVLGDEPRYVNGIGPLFSLPPEHVWEQAILKAYAPGVGSKAREEAEEIQRVLSRWALVSRKLEDLAAEIKPYVDEYVRRGRWNRVYLAQSHDGHAHNGTECSTCHHGEQRTQFAWLIRYSGKSEAEIVADAGWRACTTCYPSAPVGDRESLPTKMFTPDEEEQARARAEREAARAKRAADKTAKGITNPDGSPLRSKHGGIIETERTAEIEAVDGLSEKYKRLRFQQLRKADPGISPFLFSDEDKAEHEERGRADALRLVEAIAHKRGTTAEEVLAELEPKAQAKARRLVSGKDFAQGIRHNSRWQEPEYSAYVARCKEEGREPFEVLSLRWPKF